MKLDLIWISPDFSFEKKKLNFFFSDVLPDFYAFPLFGDVYDKSEKTLFYQWTIFVA